MAVVILVSKLLLPAITVETCIGAGGMQDYNYIFAGCFELTLEISCCKFPANETELLSHWRKNRDALMLLLVQSHIGMHCVYD